MVEAAYLHADAGRQPHMRSRHAGDETILDGEAGIACLLLPCWARMVFNYRMPYDEAKIGVKICSHLRCR